MAHTEGGWRGEDGAGLLALTQLLHGAESLLDVAGQTLSSSVDPGLLAGGRTQGGAGSCAVIQHQLDTDLGPGGTLQHQDVAITGSVLLGDQGVREAGEWIPPDHIVSVAE